MTLRMSFYGVRKGILPGVYRSWSECQKQISGFCKAEFRKFPTEHLAWEFVLQKGMDTKTRKRDHAEPSPARDARSGIEISAAHTLVRVPELHISNSPDVLLKVSLLPTSQPSDTPFIVSPVHTPQPFHTPARVTPVYTQPRDTHITALPVHTQPRDTHITGLPVHTQPRDTPITTLPVHTQPRDTPITALPVHTQPTDTPIEVPPVHAKPTDTTARVPEVHTPHPIYTPLQHKSQQDLDNTVCPSVFEALGMLRSTANSLRSVAEQMLFSIDSLSKQIESMASILNSGKSSDTGFSSVLSSGNRTATNFSSSWNSGTSTAARFSAKANVVNHLKRSYSNFSPLGPPARKAKKSRMDANGYFTGIPFADKDGTPVYTDGASVYNGQANARAGIGVFWSENSKWNTSERLSGKQTNNRAEINAARVAVEQAKTMGIENLILYTDSEFLIKGITKWIKRWKKNDWKLITGGPVINREDFQQLDDALKGINVKWVHIRGHQGHYGNVEADRLANQGANKPL